MQDLHILPKLRDSLSYIYAEHALIDREQQGIDIVKESGRIHVPASALSVLMLGPGTKITHGAVYLLTQSGCSIMWVGEDATRFYAQGLGETRRGYRTLRQAEMVCDSDRRDAVVRRMYAYRFEDELEPGLSIEQIRGMEGVRMRNAYAHASRRWGVEWHGRRYDRGQWGASDPINRALSAANALLNGICHAAIVSGGYSSSLGFIHTGKQLSFVYDVADLYKTEFTIPAAFEVVANGQSQIEPRVRALCRERFRDRKLLERILPDIDRLLAVEDEPESELYDSDPAMPGDLWSGPVSDEEA